MRANDRKPAGNGISTILRQTAVSRQTDRHTQLERDRIVEIRASGSLTLWYVQKLNATTRRRMPILCQTMVMVWFCSALLFHVLAALHSIRTILPACL